MHAIRNAIRAPSCLLYLIGPKRRNWLTHISGPNLRVLDATYYPKVICSYRVADLKYEIDELVWLSRCCVSAFNPQPNLVYVGIVGEMLTHSGSTSLH
jgi:hypothetical protein